MCDAIVAERTAVVNERQALVTSLNAALQGAHLKFLKSSSHHGRERFQNRYGTEAGQLLGFVQSFGNAETYQNLRSISTGFAISH